MTRRRNSACLRPDFNRPPVEAAGARLLQGLSAAALATFLLVTPARAAGGDADEMPVDTPAQAIANEVVNGTGATPPQ